MSLKLLDGVISIVTEIYFNVLFLNFNILYTNIFELRDLFVEELKVRTVERNQTKFIPLVKNSFSSVI